MARPVQPVDLTSTDRGRWFSAGMKGQRNKPNRTIANELKLSNRFRFWRLRRDFKWAQKTAARHGHNPEDVRYLL